MRGYKTKYNIGSGTVYHRNFHKHDEYDFELAELEAKVVFR
jgi:hypothetical protein